MPKERVAVLGGGMGALTAAYELTRTEALRERYDVTVYQLGWRLGGKCASGRDTRPGYGARILEHGLHILAGFYENTFHMLRETYGALGRPRGTPLSVWYDASDRATSAFWPRSHVTYEERVRDGWRHWAVELPRNSGLPGDGGMLRPDMWNVARTIFAFTAQLLREAFEDRIKEHLGLVERLLQRSWWPIEGVACDLGSAVARSCRSGHDGANRAGTARGSTRTKSGHRRHEPAPDAAEPTTAFFGADGGVSKLTWFLATLLRQFDGWTAQEDGRSDTGPLRQTLERFHDWLADALDALGLDDTLRRLWIMADLSLSTLRGLIADEVVTKGFEAINHLDWADWLHRHGASEQTLESPLVRGIYDYVLAYEHGDTADRAKRRLEAGTAVHGIWRLAFTYRGAIFWEMQAAMGECIFTPLYQLLKQRGVQFEFFHRVDGLGLDDDQGGIETVTISVQATLKNPDAGYQPFVRFGQIDCWPDRPIYGQLVEGEILKARSIDLENAWSDWPDAASKVLRRGQDFDRVVLGISLGALPHLCRELIAASDRWRALVEHVQVVQTQALQLWLRPTAAELGWSKAPTTLTAYEQPFNTWGDMSFLAAAERWPAGTVGSIAYFCGPLRTLQPGDDPGRFPAEVLKTIRQQAQPWLETHASHLWPHSTPDGSPVGFDYELLVDPEGRCGVDRLDAQYLRGNVNPSDSYVLSLPGTGTKRLHAADSGFDNLYLAGDWVRTSINAGCVEAAVMAGMAAAGAISGEPSPIYGEHDKRTVHDMAAVPQSVSSSKPEYIEHGGTQVFRQPLLLRGTTFRGFVLDADTTALERLCDRMLNHPAQGRARFVPLLPKVVLGFATMDAAGSTDSDHGRWGYISEIDVAFWVPVVVLKPEQGHWRVAGLAWYLPYVFVDNPWAMATGREVYGFHKGLGRFTIPQSDTGTGLFSVSTLTFDSFDPCSAASERQLFDVRRIDDGAGGLRKRWEYASDALGELFGGVTALVGESSRYIDQNVTAHQLLGNLFSFASSSVQMVFLKQFRDAAEPTRACYQRVISARAQVKPGSLQDAGPLWGEYELRLNNFASHPIAIDLGLQPSANRVNMAFRLGFSFTMQPGTEI